MLVVVEAAIRPTPLDLCPTAGLGGSCPDPCCSVPPYRWLEDDMGWSGSYPHPITDIARSSVETRIELLGLCVFVPAAPCNKIPSHRELSRPLVPWHLGWPGHPAILRSGLLRLISISSLSRSRALGRLSLRPPSARAIRHADAVFLGVHWCLHV